MTAPLNPETLMGLAQSLPAQIAADIETAWREGWEAGYAAGREDGRWDGTFWCDIEADWSKSKTYQALRALAMKGSSGS